MRIDGVIHRGRGAVRATLCGILWLMSPATSRRYPAGDPTEDDIDCMGCIAAKERR